MKEKKDRVDDALHATQCALADGIVPGGGVALLYARKNISSDIDATDDFNFGLKIVHDACGKPFEYILTNAGYSEADAKMIEMGDLKGKKGFTGYNLKTCSVVDMKKAGILDPHKVTKNALLNAASIAGTILLTECTIVDNPEDSKDAQPMMDPSMMM